MKGGKFGYAVSLLFIPMLAACNGITPEQQEAKNKDYERTTILMADSAYKKARSQGKQDFEAQGAAEDAIEGRYGENYPGPYSDPERNFFESMGLFDSWRKWELSSLEAKKQKAKEEETNKALELEEAERNKRESDELSAATGITNGAVLAALKDVEGVRNELVTKMLDKNASGPDLAAYLKDQLRPSVEVAIRNVGGSQSDIEKAVRYFNQGIDVNLNP